MTAAWPASVPQSYLINTLQVQPERNVAAFQPEVGAAKERRRSSLATEQHSYEINLTTALYGVLMDFYRDDLADGSLLFTRLHPITGVSITCRFTQAPVAQDISGSGSVRVSIKYIKAY